MDAAGRAEAGAAAVAGGPSRNAAARVLSAKAEDPTCATKHLIFGSTPASSRPDSPDLFVARRELRISGAALMTYVSDDGPAEYLWFDKDAGFENRDTKRLEVIRDARGALLSGGPP